MVLVDTSAWIELFRGGDPVVCGKVDRALREDLVAIGDLIYCEILQGLHDPKERASVSTLLLALPQFEMVGFEMAAKSAANYRRLRDRGITIRKTIDVMIATFCVEHDLELIHHDRDFALAAPVLGLKIR